MLRLTQGKESEERVGVEFIELAEQTLDSSVDTENASWQTEELLHN